MFVGVYLLVLTFTTAECGRVVHIKRNIPCLNPKSNLQQCFNAITRGHSRPICGSLCRSLLEDYYKTCLPNSYAVEIINQICAERPNVRKCLPTFDPDSEDCVFNYALITPGSTVNDSQVCSTDCSREIRDYADKCLSTNAQKYKDQYSKACGEPAHESGDSNISNFELLYSR